MYESFKNFKERKEIEDFGCQFDELCQEIVNSGTSFNEWWLNAGMPTVLECSATNEDELLAEFRWPWNTNRAKPSWMQQTRMTPVGADVENDPSIWQRMGNQLSNIGSRFQKQPQAQAATLDPDKERKAQDSMREVKLAFNRALQMLVNKFQKERNAVGYQVVTKFLEKINQYADKVKFTAGANKFDSQAAFGPSPMQARRQQLQDPAVQQKLDAYKRKKYGIGQELAGANASPGYDQQMAMSPQYDADSVDTGTAGGTNNVPRYKPIYAGR